MPKISRIVFMSTIACFVFFESGDHNSQIGCFARVMPISPLCVLLSSTLVAAFDRYEMICLRGYKVSEDPIDDSKY